MKILRWASITVYFGTSEAIRIGRTCWLTLLAWVG